MTNYITFHYKKGKMTVVPIVEKEYLYDMYSVVIRAIGQNQLRMYLAILNKYYWYPTTLLNNFRYIKVTEESKNTFVIWAYTVNNEGLAGFFEGVIFATVRRSYRYRRILGRENY